ncbi:hypothetical protein A1D22_09150 [Pasteurellaceae bacterium LFhippo2]|nr:hypothetical protein [Pasteurellaceae bacterium LFhippo2]
MKDNLILVLAFLWKIAKFLFTILLKIIRFTFDFYFYSDPISDEKRREERKKRDQQDIQDYKNRVGKYANDKRWYDN